MVKLHAVNQKPSKRHHGQRFALVLVACAGVALAGMKFFYTKVALPLNGDSLGGSSRGQVTKQPPPVDQNQTFEVVWLMSYPISGHSDVLHLVSELSNTFVATNYGQDTKAFPFSNTKLFSNHTSPFWIFHNEKAGYPNDLVLTNTHCGAQCTNCSKTAAPSLTSFQQQCATTERLINGNETRTGSYKPDSVHKAIHLIRNPLDTIVARYQAQAGDDASPEGFRLYCQSIDEESGSSSSLPTNVPCRREFFRLIQWHSMAFVTSQDLNLNTYMLHYDWLQSRYQETAEELLTFLHLSPGGELEIEFETNLPHDDYFTMEEKHVVKQAIQSIALRKTWEQLERYFEDRDSQENQQDGGEESRQDGDLIDNNDVTAGSQANGAEETSLAENNSAVALQGSPSEPEIDMSQ